MISRQVLKQLYTLKSTLIVEGEKYKIELDGKDIVNYENELLSEIAYEENKTGIQLLVNDNQNLPGNISISFEDDKIINAKYLYLYNEAKKKYELLNNSLEKGTVKIDIAGKYLLTEKRLNSLSVNIILIVSACFCLLATAVAYIITKKKHWFW